MVTFTHPAPEGETFAQGSFASVVGMSSHIDREHGERYPVTVIGAVVADDGSSVEITLATNADLRVEEQALIGHALTTLRSR